MIYRSKVAARLKAGGRHIKLGLAATIATALLTTSSIVAAPQNERSLSLYNIHSKETTTVLFKKNGQYVAGALDKLNWAFRDWRKDEPTKMDPALFDLLWEVHTELGSREPIHIISGYRSRGTNEMLRKSVGGQASESRHILGKAADVHFPDVPLKALRYSALVRERGGVGYYPTSAIPFVHIDTDRVRHWPRLPRYELALLFPDGHSKHQPADGEPITLADVRVAQSKFRDLAVQVAAFHDSRTGKRAPVAVASLDQAVPQQPSAPEPAARAPAKPQPKPTVVASLAPQLVEQPRIVDRSSRLTATDQGKLATLLQSASFAPEPRLVSPPAPVSRPKSAKTGTRVAALTPDKQSDSRSISDLLNRDGFSNGFAQAPAFDEEHPEELSYRPFPIAPWMTATASADDPALATLIHPDFNRALDLLDQAGAMPPMHMRPGAQVAEMLWAQQFKGEAVNLTTVGLGQQRASPSGLTNRQVKTQ